MAMYEIQNVVFKYQVAGFEINQSTINQYPVKSSNRLEVRIALLYLNIGTTFSSVITKVTVQTDQYKVIIKPD